MYKKILVCLDNSRYSNAGTDLALAIAGKSGAEVTGCHVYAARLHDHRFKEMEGGLPEKYRSEEELGKQRAVHDTLIGKGLRIISDSYMAVLDEKARPLSVTVKHCHREGKNYDEIIKEANNGYDLVVLGAHGLGKTERCKIGSVAERVARRAGCDALIIKDPEGAQNPSGGVIAAIDGSPLSFGALKAALWFARAFGLKPSAVSAFDPDFHYTAFKSIAGVLTENAGRLFRFKEQEKLHNEIIDKGLARIYQNHLNACAATANEEGMTIKTTLLSGKPFNEIIGHASKMRPFLLLLGRTGVHAVPGLDIGSTAENCLREAECNVLLSARACRGATGAELKTGPIWTKEAEEILGRIPAFAKGLVKNMVEDAAKKENLKRITPELMYKVRKTIGDL